MLNKVNYMDEIKKIEKAIAYIDEGKKTHSQKQKVR